jgi:uncharacterized protein (TIGR02271 family)
MNEYSLFSRMLGRDVDEDEGRIGSAEEFGIRRSTNRSVPEVGERQWDFTVALVIETIDDLPSNFPRDSAVRIVKRTLAAAGIEIRDFNRCTWARIPQINSEIELARSREEEFREKTEEDIRSLEEEIKKAREHYQTIRAKEEEEISRASKELENIKRVRAFFGFADVEGDDDVSLGGEAAEELGPLGIGSVQQGRDPFSSHAFFSSPDTEGEENSGPSGAKADVRDSLEGAWAQIEEIRAQMKRREEGSVDPVPVNEEGTGAEIGDDEVVLPVIEDKGVVDKQPVVKEEIRVRKDVVEDEELVEKDVQKEEVDVDDRTTTCGTDRYTDLSS